MVTWKVGPQMGIILDIPSGCTGSPMVVVFWILLLVIESSICAKKKHKMKRYVLDNVHEEPCHNTCAISNIVLTMSRGLLTAIYIYGACIQ